MPLGVQLKNEAKLKEMSQILLALNAYVPFQDEVQTVQIDGESISRPETKLSPRLVYGDQLTVARARGAASLRCWHETALDRLEGYVPVTSDWHARLCVVTVRATGVHDCVIIISLFLCSLFITECILVVYLLTRAHFFS